MKLTAILFLTLILQLSADAIGQNTIIFSRKEVKLENVFKAIKKQTSYHLFFNTSIIQSANKITIEVKNAPIEQMMNLVLKDQSLTFAIKGRTMFLMNKPEEEKNSQVASPTRDPITVSGRVTDEKGNPLAGANVKVKGNNIGVNTDGQGWFVLDNVDGNGMLETTFVGRASQLLPMKENTLYVVTLKQKVWALDETVVIVYGTTIRRFYTGNVANVKASGIEKQPVYNPLPALQGRVLSLVITQATGVIGGGVVVRVQGQNRLRKENDPLYIIDGVLYYSQIPSIGADRALVNGSFWERINGAFYEADNPLNSDLKLWDTTDDTDWQNLLMGETYHYRNVKSPITT